jgi:hypothetical protein
VAVNTEFIVCFVVTVVIGFVIDIIINVIIDIIINISFIVSSAVIVGSRVTRVYQNPSRQGRSGAEINSTGVKLLRKGDKCYRNPVGQELLQLNIILHLRCADFIDGDLENKLKVPSTTELNNIPVKKPVTGLIITSAGVARDNIGAGSNKAISKAARMLLLTATCLALNLREFLYKLFA